MTQYRLSKLTGISLKTINDWWNKKTNPGADKIMVICEVLGVSPEALLSGNERNDENSSAQPSEEAGTADEVQVLRCYRSFSERNKKRLLAYMSMLENIKQ